MFLAADAAGIDVKALIKTSLPSTSMQHHQQHDTGELFVQLWGSCS
jgi:hypothetical protein